MVLNFFFLLLSFSQTLKITVSTLLLAISKRFELQEPDCAHLVDFLKQINFFFKKVSNISRSQDILV